MMRNVAEIRCFSMVEPRGIEPLTSTMPLNEPLNFPPFSVGQIENKGKTVREQDEFSVPLGPKLCEVELSERQFRRARRLMPESNYAKFTYFLRDEVTGEIKIGMSNAPHRRAEEMRLERNHPVSVLVELRGGACERHYHNRYAEHRLEGEWFEPAPAILSEIERIKEGE